jgi:hypothetical protein
VLATTVLLVTGGPGVTPALSGAGLDDEQAAALAQTPAASSSLAIMRAAWHSTPAPGCSPKPDMTFVM